MILEDGEGRRGFRGGFFFRLEEPGIEKAAGFDVSKGIEQSGLQVRVLLLKFVEDGAEGAADGSGFQGAAARDDGSARGLRPCPGKVFRDVKKRADEAELAAAGPDDRGQGGEASGEHGVAQEGLAEIVGGVTEGDDVGAEFAGKRIDGAAAEAAAEVAAVIGLIGEQAEGGVVGSERPRDAVLEHPLAEGLDGGEELALIDGEGGQGEADGGALLEEEKR